MKDLSFEVLPLQYNRVERFYKGGKGLDHWRNAPEGDDTYLSEDMMVSTCKYIGPGKSFDDGFSQTLVDGKPMRLASIIQSDLNAYLGEKYANKTFGNSAIMCRVGDSVDRLILQYHPTDEFAQKYFGAPFGKTEAWYIVATRGEGEHFCYVGFKKGVTKEKFVECFKNGDSDGMTNMLHKIYFKRGDMVLVKAGTVHAMGGGTTFLEMHPPCDYTMRLETNFAGRHIREEDLHYGLGLDKLFEGIDFSTYTEEEMYQKALMSPRMIDSQANSQRLNLLSYDVNPEFRVDKLVLDNCYTLNCDETHLIAVAVKGDVEITSNNITKKLSQGSGAFIPKNAAKELIFCGQNAEVALGFPFKGDL